MTPGTGTRRALLFGAAGMLGSECLRAAPAGLTVTGATRADADIGDLDSTLAFVRRLRPDVVVNAAAYTAVDAAESDRAAAFRANLTGARNLAIACRETGARLTHVSTDFVFDGRATQPYAEDDRPNPQGAYAESKHAGERAVVAMGGDWQIVRTQWVFGARGKHFVAAIVKAARERDRLTVVNDQRGCPTCTFDLAPEIWRLALGAPGGMFHASSNGDCSWFEFAREIVRLSTLTTPIDPITTEEWARSKPGAAPRPAYSVLSKGHLSRTIGNRFPEWKEAVKGFFDRGDAAL